MLPTPIELPRQLCNDVLVPRIAPMMRAAGMAEGEACLAAP
jgi:hypothetical protein